MPEFKRTNKEVYGESTVRLEKLNMAKPYNHLTVSGVDIDLPVLNVKKYNHDVQCYALIERLKNSPITFVDVLYSYKDILYQFENDEMFRRQSFELFNREKIIAYSLTSPILTVNPRRNELTKSFASSVKMAVQDSVDTGIFLFSVTLEDKVEVEIPKDPNTVKQDSIMLDFIKSFYEIISGEKAKRPEDPDIETIDYTMDKSAIIMKSGSMIIDQEEVEKYYSTFRTLIDNEELDNIKDTIAIYISGTNSKKMADSPEFRTSFGDALLRSNVLEAFSQVNPYKLPKLSYVGQYDDKVKRLRVNKNNERYFDKINEGIIPTKQQDEGR